MTLYFYIARRFLNTFLRVLAIVLAIIFLFQFVENMRKFSDTAESIQPILTLTMYQIPSSLSRMFPLVMMLASLTLFVGLARSSELVITRASGVSALRLLRVPVLVAILIGIATTTVFNPIVAATTRQYELLNDQLSNSERSVLSISQDGLWLRQSGDNSQSVIHARRSSADGSILYNVEFHVFDAFGGLSERIVARSAQLVGNAWQLADVRRWKVDSGVTETAGPMERRATDAFPTDLTSVEILDSFAPPETVSFWDLPGFISRLEGSGFSATRHKQFFQSAIALPVLFAAMVMVGAGFTMRHVRFGGVGLMVLTTVLAGFALYSFNNVISSLGASGALPVALSAWAIPVATIMMVLGLLLHLEDG